jgi:hypothetical protein
MTVPTRETHLRTLSRLLPDRSFIVATVGLSKLDGNAQAYWTATVEIYEPRGTHSGEARWRAGRDSDAGGADHDAIRRAWPVLESIVAMHLSDADGVPMHALANGRYHLANGNPEAAARLWRCPVSDLPSAADVEAFVEAQRERWARESAHAWDLLQTIQGGL